MDAAILLASELSALPLWILWKPEFWTGFGPLTLIMATSRLPAWDLHLGGTLVLGLAGFSAVGPDQYRICVIIPRLSLWKFPQDQLPLWQSFCVWVSIL